MTEGMTERKKLTRQIKNARRRLKRFEEQLRYGPEAREALGKQ